MIRIAIKTYLHKYLTAQIGAEKIELKKVKQMDLFAGVAESLTKKISDILIPFLRTSGGYNIDELGFKNYRIMLFVPSDNMISQRRVHLPAAAIMKLNQVIYEEMMAELRMLTDVAISNGERQDMAILHFMNKYDIDEEEIRMDSLKKNLYRNRLKASKKNLSQNISGTGGVLDLSFYSRMISR